MENGHHQENNKEENTTNDDASSNDNETKDGGDLLNLLRSWDVETFLEQSDNNKTCEYFKSSGSCPYQEVGCMFSHEQEDDKDDTSDDEEEVVNKEDEKKLTTLQSRERLSARSRNRNVNEERFRRLRDLSISCS